MEYPYLRISLAIEVPSLGLESKEASRVATGGTHTTGSREVSYRDIKGTCDDWWYFSLLTVSQCGVQCKTAVVVPLLFSCHRDPSLRIHSPDIEVAEDQVKC